MTKSFDAGRWWLLVGKHWSENRKKYSLSLIAMAGLLLLWFVFVLITDSYRSLNISMQSSTWYFGLFVVGCLYASTLFADLGSKTRGLNYLTVPASHLEKLLCALFYAVLVFFVCYTAIFYLVDIVMVKTANAIAYSRWVKDHTPGDAFNPLNIVNIFSINLDQKNASVYVYLLLFYFVLQAAFYYRLCLFCQIQFH